MLWLLWESLNESYTLFPNVLTAVNIFKLLFLQKNFKKLNSLKKSVIFTSSFLLFSSKGTVNSGQNRRLTNARMIDFPNEVESGKSSDSVLEVQKMVRQFGSSNMKGKIRVRIRQQFKTIWCSVTVRQLVLTEQENFSSICKESASHRSVFQYSEYLSTQH